MQEKDRKRYRIKSHEAPKLVYCTQCVNAEIERYRSVGYTSRGRWTSRACYRRSLLTVSLDSRPRLPGFRIRSTQWLVLSISVFPNRLQIQIPPPLRPTNTPPLPLIPSSEDNAKTVCPKDHTSSSRNIQATPSLLCIAKVHATITVLGFVVSRSFKTCNVLGFKRSFFGVR